MKVRRSTFGEGLILISLCLADTKRSIGCFCQLEGAEGTTGILGFLRGLSAHQSSWLFASARHKALLIRRNNKTGNVVYWGTPKWSINVLIMTRKKEMVGARRFEHPTSGSQNQRSTKLSYAPTRAFSRRKCILSQHSISITCRFL